MERTELRDTVLLLLEAALEVGGRHLVLRDGHARCLQALRQRRSRPLLLSHLCRHR